MDSPLLPRTTGSQASASNLLNESVESNFADLTVDDLVSTSTPPPADVHPPADQDDEDEQPDATLRRTLYELQGLNKLFDKLLAARRGVNAIHQVRASSPPSACSRRTPLRARASILTDTSVDASRQQRALAQTQTTNALLDNYVATLRDENRTLALVRNPGWTGSKDVRSLRVPPPCHCRP